MIAAIYARKSTDQAGAGDKSESVERQLAHARAYAARKGWTVNDAYVYSDDGISGAEFVKRPGFLRLMNALKPRPPFHVLVMSEESRLGREQIETAWSLKQLVDAGVQVWFYLEDRQRTLDSAIEKVMLSLTNFAAEMERERARQRTRDAMARKATRGHVAGGLVYGYVNREITRPGSDGRAVRDHVVREIHQEQGAVIRRIVTLAAEGSGYSRIAKTLNAERVPAPRGRRGWATSGVREILLRDLYRGRVVWGKTRWVDKGGTKVKQDTPESAWLVLEQPELRIVPEDLWRAAQARLEQTRDAYHRATNGSFKGLTRPIDRGEARYLFAGLLSCSVCTGVMHGTNRTGTRARPRRYYVCATHRERGNMLCQNWLAAPIEALHAGIVGSLERDILSEDFVAEAIQYALRLRAEAQDGLVRQRPELEAELRRVEGELRRYAEAIATAGSLPSLLEQLRVRERRRQALHAQLQHLDGAERSRATMSERALVKTMRERVAGWRGLLERHAMEARSLILKPLFPERIVLTPQERPEGRFYEFLGRPSYGGLISGLIGHGARAVTVVPPG